MKQNDNPKYNKGNIFFGLLLLGIGLYPFKNSVISDQSLNSHWIVARDISYIGGSRFSSGYYRIIVNGIPASLIVNDTGMYAMRPIELSDSIKTGDTVLIKYLACDTDYLYVKTNKIPIYYIKKGNIEYLNPAIYARGGSAYAKRLRIFGLIIGLFSLLSGLKIFSSRTMYILGGIGVAIAIILRAMNII
jgi:hypothetical protein